MTTNAAIATAPQGSLLLNQGNSFWRKAATFFGSLAFCALPVLAQQTNLAVTVRHAPNLNGSGLIQGSVQQLLGASVTINGGFIMTGDLLVPGTPTLKVNGNPAFGGTVVGSGGTSPSGYQVTLNGNCSLHYLRTRTTPVSLPTVATPPQPSGTRSVNINSTGQSIGDAATIRNLTLNGNVGQYVIPPGTYGDFIANGGSGFTLGVSGATHPAIYNLQNLTLNGQSHLNIVGPVILTVASGFSANGILGATNQPSWLQLQIASGGFMLNGGCTVYGNVTVPAGTVIINGNSLLVGLAKCDRLIVNSGGIIRAGSAPKQTPAADAQSLTVAEDGVLNVTLTGSDAEGATLTYLVLSQPGHGTLTGTTPHLVYAPAANFNGLDSFTFKVNDGQADSATATVSITVDSANDAPAAQSQSVSTPEDTSLSILLSGSDVENSPLAFQVVTTPAHGALSGTAPNLTYTPAAHYSGPDNFTYQANDGETNSPTATVSISVNPVDDAPVAATQTVTTDEDAAVNITLSAVDVEGYGLDFAVNTQPVHGTLNGTPPNLVYTPAVNYHGSDSFTFSASDAWLESAPATITLVVRAVNDTPEAGAQTLITPEDTATNLLLTATDVDGDTLSYELVTGPANGTLNGATPGVVFSPGADFNGTNTFTFVAVDGNSTSAPVTITLVVTPVNDPPVAEAKTISLNEDTGANIALTGTDVDGDALTFVILSQPTNGVLSGTAPNLVYTPSPNFVGADCFAYAANDGTSNSTPAIVALTIQSVNDAPFANEQSVTTDEDIAATVTLTGSDVENDSLTFTVVTSPAHGNLSGAPPTLIYTPATNYSGTDSFIYVAGDGQTSSASATVTITVHPINDAPIATTATVNTLEDTSAALTLTGADGDGDDLTFTVTSGPTHGSLSGTSPTLIYTPTPNHYGPDQFSFTANDGSTNSQPAVMSIVIVPVNDAPTATPQSVTTDEEVAVAITLTGSDVDGNALAYSIETLPAHGTLSGVAPDLTYTPAANYFGPDGFTFKVNDGVADSSLASVSITLRRINRAPVVSAGWDQTNNSLQLDLFGTVADDGLPTGTPVTVQWSRVSGPGAATFSDATTSNSVVTFSQAGVYVLRMTANDSELEAMDDILIVANSGPQVDAGTNQAIQFGLPVVLHGVVTDDGLPVGQLVTTWQLFSGPGQVIFTNINSAQTAVTMSGPGEYVFRLVATDTLSTNSDETVVSITAANLAPLVSVGPKQLVLLHATATLHAGVTDDGLPTGGALAYQWTKVSGPGDITFTDATATNTTASFSAPGDYVVRGTANDSALAGFAELKVAVRTPAMNEPPVVYAGENLVIGLTNVTTLGGFASDDGLPQGGALTFNWTVVSGPGATVFANASTTNTSASFASVGTYVLRLTASDSSLATSADVTVTVYPFNQPPLVAAGEDQTVTIPAPALFSPIGQLLDPCVALQTSLSSVPRWNNQIGQPGLSRPVYWDALSYADGILYAGSDGPNFVEPGTTNHFGVVGRWDGTNWAGLYSPATTHLGGPVFGYMTVPDPTPGGVKLVARGKEVFLNGGFLRNLNNDSFNEWTARWDGTAWRLWLVQTVSPSVGFGEFVSMPEVIYQTGEFSFNPTNWTTGYNNGIGFTNLPVLRNAAAWDGTNWTGVGGGFSGPIFSAASGPDNKFYVGGSFRVQTPTGIATNIAVWDGANWSPLGGGVFRPGQNIFGQPIDNTQVRAIAVADDGSVYVGGDIALAGNVAVHNIARWNGTNWSALGTVPNDGVNGSVYALGARGRDLFVSGSFTHAGGVSARRIARWNGLDWRPLGTGSSNGVNAAVRSLAVAPNGIYLGGDFTEAGGELANHVAFWEFPTEPQRGVLLTGHVVDDGLPNGQLSVQWNKVSGPGTPTFVNSTSAVTSITFNQLGTYVLRLSADDTEFTTLDEVTITLQGNQPPVVSAGTNQVVGAGGSTILAGSVTDDGLPVDEGIASAWSVISGPGTVDFENLGNPQSPVTFGAAGTYVLRLSANDSQFTTSADITVQVLAANAAPSVSAFYYNPRWWDPRTIWPEAAALLGSVYDDDQPNGTLRTVWSQISGPGTVTFADARAAATEVSFPTPGTYQLRLTATDSQLSGSTDVTVEVYPPENSSPPLVYAGPDQQITLPATANLSGALLTNAPITDSFAKWGLVAGPGSVTFTDEHSLNTSANFSEPGVYELAFDLVRAQWWGAWTVASDTLFVTVAPTTGANQPPQVYAGAPRCVPITQVINLGGSMADDGLPSGGGITLLWSQVDGPAPVVFGNANSANATAIFPTPGQYILQLWASDSELSASNTVVIDAANAAQGNLAPVVEAGTNQILSTGNTVSLAGNVTDDGLPGVPLMLLWTKVSGRGAVIFSDAYALQPSATFSEGGTYVLRLRADDGSLANEDDVTIEVDHAVNQPPVVDAGAPGLLFLPTNSVTLNGAVFDDGLPAGGFISYHWEVVWADGEVIIGDTNLLSPAVVFPNPPIDYFGYPAAYQLALIASDSELSATNTVDIFISDTNLSTRLIEVEVSADQTVTLPNVAILTNSPGRFQLSEYGKIEWRLVNGPRPVRFETTYLDTPDGTLDQTSAFFTAPGVYVLRANVSDYGSVGAAITTVTVLAATNLAPEVYAGPAVSITIQTPSVTLTGRVLDDDYPTNSAITAQWTLVSGAGNVAFADATAPTTAATFDALGTYTLRLTADDGVFTNSNEVIVTVYDPTRPNQPPFVVAGTNLVIRLPDTAQLDGFVSDDGLPLSGSTTFGLTYSWSQDNGPGWMSFADAGATKTTVTFAVPGEYRLRLHASDGVCHSSADISVTVLPATNTPPFVHAGFAQIVGLGAGADLNGLVLDDGLPNAENLSASWSVVSGSGGVTFSQVTNAFPSATAHADFSTGGEYVLRLTADDSASSSTSDVTITVSDIYQGNQAPVVSAGSNLSTFILHPVTLDGAVTDDGQPANSEVASTWSLASGPGLIRFADAGQTNTSVTFYLPGTYVLRLTADDGRMSSGDEITITVPDPVNETPLVFAGGHQVVTRPDEAWLDGVVLDDELPLGYPLLFQWSKVSGPGTVTFTTSSNVAPDTTPCQEVDDYDALAFASFSTNGTYVLRLTGTDTQYTNTDEVTITVLPGVNSAPGVYAGQDQSISLPYPALLTTDVTDDGLENGTVQISWSNVSGPGPVAFSTVNGVYRATFTTTGEYVLRLTANDGALSAGDDVTVTVHDVPEPIAEINSPAEAGIITAPTAIIGTASSAILQSYILEYRLAPPDSLSAGGEGQGEVAWSVLASNTVLVVSNTLATFDPTLLLNGIYELRLTAADFAGRSTVTEPITVIVDRNLKIGHFTVSFNDLTAPVPGLPLQIARTYDSRAAAAGIQGDFGIGWTLDIRNVRLQKNRSLSRNWEQTTTGSPWDLSLAYHLNSGKPRIVTITFPDGRVEKFQFIPNPMDQALLPIEYPQWRFVPLGNTRGTLVPAGYGEPDGHFLAFSGSIPGGAELFDLNFFFDWLNGSGTEEELFRHPTLFSYNTPEGYRYLIDELAGLQSVTDPNGNTLLVSTNGLTWSNSVVGTNSLSIAFQRDAQGRITNIVDAAGHAMSYAYAANGNLDSFRDRNGHPNRFAYTNPDFAHHLTGIVDGRGTNALQNIYDQDGRIAATLDALGNAIRFGNEPSLFRQTVTNRLGFVTVNEFDELGRLARKTDALGLVTTYAYDANDNLITISNAACACATRYSYDADGNLLTETDELGRTGVFTYSPRGKILTYTDLDGYMTTNSYDARGNLLTTRDPLGSVTAFTYTGLGQVATMTDPRGGVTQFQYDPQGRLTNEIDGRGYATKYTVDANGNLRRMTREQTLDFVAPATASLFRPDEKVLPCILVLDSKRTNVVFTYTYDNGGHLVTAILPDGTGVTNNYDASDHIVSTTDQLGQTTTTDYNAAGRPLQVSFPDGTSERMAYDAEGQLITHFDRANRKTQFTYDPVGRLKQATYADGRIVEARYNERGWLTNEIDACRGDMTYAYDEVGNRISATDALGRTATYTYNAKRACTSATDPLGRVTTMDYDALNRNIAIHYPNGKTRGASYAGRLVTVVTNEDGSTRQFLYDNNGNLTRVTDPLGQVSRFEYDSVGNLVLETDADGETVSHEYDTRHRRMRTVLPDGSVHSYTHDALGRMTSTRDSAGQVTKFDYDERNNLIAVTNALGQVTRYGYNPLGQRIAQTDASGQVTQWTYDAVGRVVSTRFPDGSTEGRSYDSCGRVSTLVDRAGGTRSFAYDAVGQVTAVTDPLQRQTRFSYDAAGSITSQLDAAGQFTRFTYDRLNRRVATQLPDGTSVSQGYDARGRLAFASDALGHSRQFGYDANGRLNSVTDPLGRATTYGYDNRGKLATVTDALGRTTGYGYDENGRLIQTIRADGSVLGFGYDSRGLLSAATNALGRLTHYSYDDLGRLTGETNALGNATVYAYDALGRMTARTDANGVITRFEYDALGRLTRTVYADGATESSAYDPAGNLVANTDARSNITHYAYDLEGRLVQITDALTNVTTFTYDTLGRRDTMVDALGRTNLYAYDLLGRLLRTTYPDGSSVVNLYDAAGRRVAVVDEAGHTNSFGYDAANRLTSVTNALGHVTVYAYDELGRLIGQTDANGRVTTYQHDALGRRIGRTLPGGASETFAYDPAGNLTNHVDFNGRVCTYAYDALDRPVQKTPDPFFAEPPVTWAYDPVGLRTNMTDAAGATHYAYDIRYRLSRKTRAWNDSATASSLNYSYDPAGNVSGVTSSETNGVTLAYAYDVLNRLATVTDPRTGTTTYGYDPLSHLSQITQPNGLHTAFQRDARNRVTQMDTFSAAGFPVSAYAYTLDATGRRVGAVEKLAINGLTNDLARAYTYDAAYQLTSETITANAQSFALNYTYDPVGNRLARVSSLNSVPAANYAYDADDQLTSDTYDANGNTLAAIVTDPFTALPVPVADAYDHANRLVQRVTTLNSQPATLRFQYDGDGQRVAKSAGGVTTHFQVDELNPTGWPQVLEEHSASTAQPSTPAVTRVYAYGHAPLTQDQWDGATWTANHFGQDAHGNVRYLTDPTGQVSDGMDYDAFGNLIGRAGNTPITRLFTGEEFDPDLGLYQLRARYHNPASGRFWTRDSFEGWPSDPASQHGYAYGQNDPVNRIDPSGHFALAESLAVSGIAVTARQMMSGLWSGLNNYTHGLGGGEALKAVNAVEGLFIQGLSQHAGINLGRQNFFATMQGAPFLLAQNPYTYRPACECFRYEVVGWDPDAPVYGARSRNAVFEFDFANDAAFRFATSLADVGHGSLLGAELREWAANQARLGTQGGEGFGLWANYFHNVQADVANLLAGAISPQSWVEGVEHLQDRAEERMSQELVGGRGGWDARYQGWASLGGDLLGLNGVLEGTYNVDLATGQALGTEERWRRGPMGVAQMAGVLTPATAAQTARQLNARQLAVVEGRAVEALAKSAPPSAEARLVPKGVASESPCFDPRTTAAVNGKGGLNVVGDNAEGVPDAYAGIRQASKHLQEMGVSRADRVRYLQSFEPQNMVVRQAGQSEFGLRYFSDPARTGGQYLFETFPASRSSLAIKPEWSTMAGFRQFQIRPGATFFEGRAAAQGANLPGSQIQKFILDWRSDLIAP